MLPLVRLFVCYLKFGARINIPEVEKLGFGSHTRPVTYRKMEIRKLSGDTFYRVAKNCTIRSTLMLLQAPALIPRFVITDPRR